jgi:hypothetical protein
VASEQTPDVRAGQLGHAAVRAEVPDHARPVECDEASLLSDGIEQHRWVADTHHDLWVGADDFPAQVVQQAVGVDSPASADHRRHVVILEQLVQVGRQRRTVGSDVALLFSGVRAEHYLIAAFFERGDTSIEKLSVSGGFRSGR